MSNANSQPQIPFDAIIFDCDSTLTTIEGIDVLAEQNNVAPEVKALTEEAMSHSGLNAQLYERRLQLVLPTQEQVLSLGHEYFAKRTKDASEIISLLQRLNKSIYIVTAALSPSAKIFGELLGIPAKNIFGVDIRFNDKGEYLDFDKNSALVKSQGKREIVTQIKQSHKEIAYIGDGLNDYETHDLVTRFIGFGGVVYRKNIAELCEFYIKSSSLLSLLPLLLTHKESSAPD